MIRILIFLAVVFALGLGFAWLAERPGEMVLTFDGYEYQVSLMVAAVIIVGVVAAVMIGWWLLKALWNSPYLVARYFRVRRRDRGYQALSTGMIAAGAGDGALARKKNREASKLIRSDQEPLIHLLDAQASLLEGDHAAARKTFEAMLADPEMRILGLRGLYLEAQRLGDRDAARHYAERAADIAPQLDWASNATLEARTAEGDWDKALALLDARKATKLVEATTANRQRAVLLTAKAMSLADRDPLAAKNAAVEANRLAPDLVPAAIIAAKALFRQGDLRKGSKILEAAWRKHAHPDIADAYIHARHGDSVLDRLARARKLQAQRQNNAESALALARAAMEAGDTGLARQMAEQAARIQPREAAFLLLADIEEADGGSEGAIRQWLARAVRAPEDPAWIADGVVSERWLPASPVTGRLDAFEWRLPVERPAKLIEPDKAEKPKTLAPAVPVIAPSDNDAETPAAEAADAPATTLPEPVADPATPSETPPATAPALPAAANDDAAVQRGEELVAPRPDDPGVDPGSKNEENARRFRLF